MAENHASDELPGHVPGEFPGTPGEGSTAQNDYMTNRTPFKSGGSSTSEAPQSFPGGGAAGTYSTIVDAKTHQRHRSFGRPAATYGKPTSHGDSSTTGETGPAYSISGLSSLVCERAEARSCRRWITASTAHQSQSETTFHARWYTHDRPFRRLSVAGRARCDEP